MHTLPSSPSSYYNNYNIKQPRYFCKVSGRSMFGMPAAAAHPLRTPGGPALLCLRAARECSTP